MYSDVSGTFGADSFGAGRIIGTGDAIGDGDIIGTRDVIGDRDVISDRDVVGAATALLTLSALVALSIGGTRRLSESLPLCMLPSRLLRVTDDAQCLRALQITLAPSVADGHFVVDFPQGSLREGLTPLYQFTGKFLQARHHFQQNFAPTLG